MARTRSYAAAQFAGKSTKFLDDGSLPLDVEVVTIESRESTREPDNRREVKPEPESESESGSDSDSAPEEEATSVAKSKTIELLKEQKQRQQEIRKQEREKRKQRDEHLKLQLEARRERIRELVEAEELPELLPEEVFDTEPAAPKGKHIRLEELEKEHLENRKRAKLEKLRQIKDLRKQALKKGPVHVQVQTFGLRTVVPRAEASVLETKNSWLQRESLGKR